MVNINATLIAQILNFLFLVFILAKFVYKPLLNVMEARKNKIASDLEAADTAKVEAEAVKAEYAAKLADARQEAQAIIENARKNAQAAHDKIMAETKAEHYPQFGHNPGSQLIQYNQQNFTCQNVTE